MPQSSKHQHGSGGGRRGHAHAHKPNHGGGEHHSGSNNNNNNKSSGGQQQQHQQQHNCHDERHNDDHPCCQKLALMAQRMFGGDGGGGVDPADPAQGGGALAILWRDYLLSSTSGANGDWLVGNKQLQQQTSPPPPPMMPSSPTTTTVSSAKNHKKKRKKKEKKTNGGDDSGVATTPDDCSPDADDTTISISRTAANDDSFDHKVEEKEEDQQPEQQRPGRDHHVPPPDGLGRPRDRLATLWNDHLLSTTSDEVALQRSRRLLETVVHGRFLFGPQFNDDDDDDENAPSVLLPLETIDAVAIPFLKQELIERRLDRVIGAFLLEQRQQQEHPIPPSPRFTPSPKSHTAGQDLTNFLACIAPGRGDAPYPAAAAANDNNGKNNNGATWRKNRHNNYNNDDDDDPFFVPLPVVEKALSHIVCTACRGRVHAELQSASRKGQLVLEGASFATVLDDYKDTSVAYRADSAYQLMEEGHLPSFTRDRPRWRFVAEEREQTRGWRLTRPVVVEPGGDGESSAWSASDLDFLLKHYLLMMGFPSERFFPRFSDDVETDIIAGDVEDHVKALLNGMELVGEWIKKAKAELDTGRPLPTDDVVNLDQFEHLKAADGLCDSVFNLLLDTAVTITKAVSYVQAQYGRDPTRNRSDVQADIYWATRQCYLMWEVWLDGVADVLHKLNDYDTVLFATASRQGGLEEIYISKQRRIDYHAYVQQKIGVVESAASKFGARLQHETTLGNNAGYPGQPIYFVQRLFLEDKFFRMHMSTQPFRDPHQEINQAFHDVMTVLREVTVTIHGPNIERIVDEDMIRWAKFWRVLRGVVECVKDRQPTADDIQCGNDQYAMQIRGMHRQLVHILKVGREEGEDDSDDAFANVIAWRKNACVYLMQLVEHWSSLSTFASMSNFCLEALPALSRSALQRLVKQSKKEYGPCRGGHGTGRLACCLIAEVFEGVVKRFEEYQSHQAMQELLVDTESNSESKATTKKGPKKKKKKKRTVAGSEQKENISMDVVADYEVRDCGVSDKPVVVQEGADKTDLEDPAMDGNVVRCMILSANGSNGSGFLEASKCFDRESSFLDGTTDLSVYDDEIGVYDGSVFIPAETFFLKRLEALLMSDEKVRHVT